MNPAGAAECNALLFTPYAVTLDSGSRGEKIGDGG
jgi:hypothetical protein